MKTYTIHSTSWLNAPGFVRWIEEAILPFDPNKARELYEALGVPADVAEILIEPDRYFHIRYGEDTVTITNDPALHMHESIHKIARRKLANP